MAGKTASFYLSEEALSHLDAIVEHRMTGMDANRSAAVEVAINDTYAALKRIETSRDGRKIVGYNGFFGGRQVAYEEKTEALAKAKVDAYAYEELRRC